ncbi:MAG: hypothetical protein ACR2KV_02820 [Solirubrobacteraceae bacterium]
MAGTRKKVDVSRQEPRAPETPTERRARQAAQLADQQAQLRREAEERRVAKRRREAAAETGGDS